MEPAVNITYRDIPSSPYVEAAVRDWILRLGRLSRRIQRCEVVIERPHQHHRHGHRYDVRVDLNVGDRVISVSREPGVEPAHENIYVAIRDTFRAARRQLQDHARIKRGDVKLHAAHGGGAPL
ncbi:MAG TPA: HPF/RaiA family ribosome-associated protein [Kofleriaceae bacterium]|jgi:hypothetical protein|nr:HPF/RaiA family ribosome-associated protein [Kofleriaceae bacterium]